MDQNFIVQYFSNEVFGSVRYSIVDGIPYFCLVDICERLGFNMNSNPVSRLKNGIIDLYNSSEEPYRFSKTVGVPVIEVPLTIQTGIKSDGSNIFQTTNLLFINEPSVYYVIFQSRKPEANMFKSWVFNILLPTVRQVGFNNSIQALQQYNMRLQQELNDVSVKYDNQQIGFANQAIDFAFACGDRDKYKSNIENADFLTQEQKEQLLNLEDDNE